jgi:hypothetical protein
VADAKLIASLVDTAKAQIALALDSIPELTDPFTVSTAFIGAKNVLGRLEALVDALHDHRFAATLTPGAHDHGQAQGSNQCEACPCPDGCHRAGRKEGTEGDGRQGR